MGIFCNDKSMTALAGLGYNVVRHPSANFRPMLLIGKQSGEFLQLGSLNQLITKPNFYTFTAEFVPGKRAATSG